ncbi:esterase-like activity of phytase family protein, partial [Brevundimonas sp.]
PLHSLSDLKLTDRDGGFVSVTDVGDLVRGRILLDAEGRLSGLDALSTRRLTLADGEPIQDKADGDAEGLVLLPNGHLLVSFERNHRIWDYGRLPGLNVRPVAVRHPDFAFAENDGMEGVAASSTGWIVTGESGGAWDCAPVGCRLITPPPATPIPDADFRITGMDRDPSGPGWFVVQRAFSLPAGPRAHIRRMAPNGELGPVLVSLKLPGTTDNFEGITAETRDGRTRLYILSDDNFSPIQRTLMLAFDVDPRP